MKKKILLIGESCKDVFIYGVCNRLNPEAPTPVFIPEAETENAGMAGNVRNNISALGYDCTFITNVDECLKTRYVDSQSNYILLRVDNDIEYKPLTIRDLPNMREYDMVIISDYNKGLLSTELIEKISIMSKLTFIDTKKEIGDWILNCDFIKINNKEYKENDDFIDNLISDKTIITMGGDGCKIGNVHVSGRKVGVRDVVGAGDTFLASLSLKYLETDDIKKSMEFANKCASEVVQECGVALPKTKLK